MDDSNSSKKVVDLLPRKHAYWGATEFSLPVEVAQKTGLTKAIGVVFEHATKSLCSEDNCNREAWALKCRITAVIDEEGQEMSINSLSPEIAKIVAGVTTEVSMCAKHLLDRYCNSDDEDDEL